MFGTDGVRGVANTELTNELAYKLGKYGAHVITNGKKKSKILIAKDTRISGDMLESAMIAGILSSGCNVIKIGVLPTPAVAYLVRYLNADAGIMISASHNPVEFNGIKFFNSEGYKLSDEIENEIEEYIIGDKRFDHKIYGSEIGRKSSNFECLDIYGDYIKSTIDLPLNNVKIALDCANGAASVIAPKTLESLGAEVIAISNEPNGLNINVNCGSTSPENIQRLVIKSKADIGLAFDGDADRLIAVDEKGELVDGDKIMAICGNYLKSINALKDNTIVSTVMSNIGFDVALKENNLNTIKTSVGDRYVLEEMKKNNYSLGGEQSGHIIFLEHNTTGDGLLSGVQLINAMLNSGKKLSELANIMTTYPQILINAKVENSNKHNYESNEEIRNEINKVTEYFEGKGRVLIRPSGTEPLVRVMIEGKDTEEIKKYAEELVKLIEDKLN
ncbi:phosphoglucosamine mutase [Clostridiaceae bacterium HSG29]|nr:phosphoglucosamine mutase [Clostridiaceae bacterium HSG29]